MCSQLAHSQIYIQTDTLHLQNFLRHPIRHQIVSFPCVQARSLALLLQSEISVVPQGALAWPVVAPALAEAPTREQDWVRAFTDSVILSPSLLPISLTSQLDPTPPPSPSPIYPCSTLVYSVNTPVHLHRSFVTL